MGLFQVLRATMIGGRAREQSYLFSRGFDELLFIRGDALRRATRHEGLKARATGLLTSVSSYREVHIMWLLAFGIG